mmetsp:Transcript_14161/g.34070  ORF Transcript_14161/g.34070 Transcript_14161/m.34070 type:complete len:201 (-) Transcript_14161:984-1586(-)
MANDPGLLRPMMSPANPSSSTVLSCPNSCEGRDSATNFLVRAFITFMPRSKRPLTTRTNATLSRCLGSMLACSLNTNPVKWSSTASMNPPVLVARPRGRTLYPRNVSRNSCTPKLFPPDPKNTGVSCPACTCSRSSSLPSSSNSSMSSISCAYSSGSIRSFSRGSSTGSTDSPAVALSVPFFTLAALASFSNRCTSLRGR